MRAEEYLGGINMSAKKWHVVHTHIHTHTRAPQVNTKGEG